MSTAEVAQAARDEPRRKLKSSSLYWFISSRHYVPISEIRRRFHIDATDGTLLHDDEGLVHIGLPESVAQAIVDLKRKGKIGLEYAPEYDIRIVIGVFPSYVRPPDLRKPDRAA